MHDPSRSETAHPRDASADRSGNRCRALWRNPWIEVHDSDWVRGRDPDTRVVHLARPALAVVRHGTCLKSWRSTTVVAAPDRVTLHNAGQDVAVSHPHGDSGRAVSILFDPELIGEVVGERHPGVRRMPAEGFPSLDIALSGEAYVRIASLVAHLESTRAPDPVAIDEALLVVLPELFRDLGATASADGPLPGPRRLRARIPEVVAWLNAHHTDRLSLSALASQFACSPWRLSRVFREEMNVSISRYLARVRVWYAVQRIVEGEENLLRLALDVGFSSHSYFTAAVRREFGCTPTALRRDGRRSRLPRPRS